MVFLSLLRRFCGGWVREGFVFIHPLPLLHFPFHRLGGSGSNRFRSNRLGRRSTFTAFAQFSFRGELAPVGHCELWFFFTHGVFPSFINFDLVGWLRQWPGD